MSRSPGHQARKRFGQNFLQDEGVITDIIRALAPNPGEKLLEIGPGLGALTEHLLEETGGQLDVIELDRDLIPILRTRFFNYPNLTIHQADALKFDFASLVTDNRKLRVIGNLPYNISTPLIFHLIESVPLIQDMHFMLQKEVVQRMAAGPGENNYGRLGIMVQYHCLVEPLIEVPPEAFKPRPKVESAVVRLTPHTRLPAEAIDRSRFEEIVRTAFNQRRKTIRNNLKKLISAEQLDAIGIDPGLRPEDLTLQNYIAISDTLS